MSSLPFPFPAVHSVPCAGALAELLRREYADSPTLSVRLLRRNINDTSLVRGLPGHQNAVLRVYRSGWRSEAEVAWELEFIEGVAAAGVPVSRPLARQHGELFGVLPAVEGPRVYAVFEHVSGRLLEPSEADAAAYGTAAARLHTAADGLDLNSRGGQNRFPLDLDHLITGPLEALRPLLEGSPDLLRELEAIAARTHTRLAALAPALEWGLCHGDLHEGNARLGEDGAVRLFDFDCGGPGWRAYDLAVYGWSLASNSGNDPEVAERAWQAFLAAYQQGRSLGQADLEAIPLFVTARSLWFMGLMAGRVHEFGTETLDGGFFEYVLNFLREWDARRDG
ncbi:phosphotransferase enzyme family protein [Deinococcus carri]|uniref:phosphotransferase enzyme family protein n=1 Tax=Deinococcus carri TaxID=1211323 RepID=UPI0031EDBCF5